MRQSPPLDIYRKIATFFIVVTIVLVGVIFYFTLTYAFVTIVPNEQLVKYDTNITVSTDKIKEDIEKGVFNGSIIKQELTAKDTFTATGHKSFQKNVKGRVVIISTNNKDQALIKTTRLLTDKNVLFRLSENVIVPANGRVETDVYPDNVDLPVDVAAGTKMTIPGLRQEMQLLIYAQALQAFEGESVEVTYVTNEDIDKAIATLTDKLTAQVTSAVPAETKLVLKTEVISKEVSALADQQVDKFTVNLKSGFTGVVMSKDTIDSYIVRMVETSLSDELQLNKVDQTATKFEIESVDADNLTAHLKAHIEASMILRKDATILAKDKMVKLSKGELISYLQNFKEIKSADVRFFPFWVHKVPSFTDHIIIEIGE